MDNQLKSIQAAEDCLRMLPYTKPAHWSSAALATLTGSVSPEFQIEHSQPYQKMLGTVAGTFSMLGRCPYH